MKEFIFFGLTLAAAAAVAAAPREPADDAVVLERLPLTRSDPAMAELRRLSGTPLARRYFELAMAQGDPRYVGYAEAALRGAAPDAETLFVRGLLKQYRHDFEGALGDFAAAAQQDPQHVGARAWRAAVFMVGARYAEARAECRALEAIASELTAVGCRAAVDAATGRAADAYAELRAALERRPDAPRETRLWVLTRLAEIAARLGRREAAEGHFREALSLGMSDNYLLAAYADFLLEDRRPREVVALLRDWARSDTLLLRLALAEKALGSAQAERHARALGERFAAAARRGERLHLAEEARYLLALKSDAKGALAAATENWKAQREPRDAAVLLEAALAAGEPSAAAPASRWLAETGLEDARLRRLAEKLK